MRQQILGFRLLRFLQISVIFGLGFSIAWTLKPGRGDDLGNMDSLHQKIERQKVSASDPYRKMLQNIRTNHDSSWNAHEFTGKLSNRDMIHLLDAYAELAGFHGLSDVDKQRLHEILDSWCERDPMAAAQWVLNLRNPRDKEDLLSGMLESIAVHHEDEFFKFADFISQNYQGVFPVSHSLMQTMANKDAESIVRLCSYTLSDHKGQTSYGVKYPENFNFQAALEGLTQLRIKAPKDYSLCITPSDLLENWAKNDPSSAWNWFIQASQHPQITDLYDFDLSIDQFLDGYRETADDKQFVDFLFENRTRIESLTDGSSFWQTVPLSIGVVEGYLDRLDNKDRERQALNILATSGIFSALNPLIEEAALSRASHEARYRFFTTEASDEYFQETNFDDTRVILKRLGHSDIEVQDMLKKAKPQSK